MKTFVIAEAGSCHDGSLAKAQDLVRLAASIGADACKFQWVSSAERLCERRRAPEYLAAYKLIEFPRDWFADLASRCEDHRIEFMCSTFLPADVAVVAPYVRRFKVSSFEAGDREFLAAHVPHTVGKSVIISLGMSGRVIFWPAVQVIPLHCVSAYPAPLEDMNLAVIDAVGDDDPRRGLSDHSKHSWTGALAVARGAEIVEFHVRLDDTDPANADFAVARDPREAAEYVANIRTAELMLGDGEKRVMPSEEKMIRFKVRP